MKTVVALCKPRQIVFDAAQRDTVHDILDFKNKNIKPEDFFEETYFTSGMKSLIKNSFDRLSGKGEESVFRLSQAMGGGKTHSMIALGLLAENPSIRKSIYPEIEGDQQVRVAVISGRMTMRHCIWGEIADQLGKLKLFSHLVSPPEAPSQEEWQELLTGQPTILLFDELPPYLEGAAGKTVGDTTLAGITTIAIANLVSAVSSKELPNCVAVFSDLSSTTHATGGLAINEAFQRATEDTGKEIDRIARVLEPVQINTDEFYKILRKRLFVEEPNETEVKEVVDELGGLLEKAHGMGFTDRDPNAFKNALADSYPFHPGIRDLYARFKENQGFQQTRALIRMMRIIISHLWESKEANELHIISLGDFVFNAEMIGELEKVNGKLEPAISADVEDSNGNSSSQNIDSGSGNTDALSVARALYFASLSTATNPVLGLSKNDIIYQLLSPSRDTDHLYSKIIPALEESCTYLHKTAEGRLYFRDVQNLIALINRIKADANRDVREKVLQERLQKIFEPVKKHLYQKIHVLPALGNVSLSVGDIVLVVFQPTTQSANDIKAFFNGQTFKNRVLFLTGQSQTYESVLDRAAFLYAIDKAEKKLKSDNVPPTDPQFIQADDLRDKYQSNFYLAVKDCFTILHYPIEEALTEVPVTFSYSGNEFNGEEQVIACLTENYKYIEDTNPDGSFRLLAEEILWLPNSSEEKWSEIRNRAGMNTNWTWHVKGALENLKDEMVKRKQWKEYSGFVHKGPHEKDSTSIRFTEKRNPKTQEVTLNLILENGDTIYYDDKGGTATTNSPSLSSKSLNTSEMEVSFLVVDSTGEFETGVAKNWINEIIIKYGLVTGGNNRNCELKAYPSGATIRYTTDNSEPDQHGTEYSVPFKIPSTCKVVQAVASLGKHKSKKPEKFLIPEEGKKFEVEPNRPASWTFRLSRTTTADAYDLLDTLQKVNARVAMVVQITAMNGQSECAELMITGEDGRNISKIKDAVSFLQDLVQGAEISIVIERCDFDLGSELIKALVALKLPAKAEEIKQ
jgi:hypothetical protein